jgi:hypothetical protein
MSLLTDPLTDQHHMICCSLHRFESIRLFYGYWPDVGNRGQTNLLVEQVSHHPPISAYVIENKKKGLRLSGHNAQKTVFNGTVRTTKINIEPQHVGYVQVPQLTSSKLVTQFFPLISGVGSLKNT